MSVIKRVPAEAEVRIHIREGVDPYERVTGPEGDEFRATLYGNLFTERDVDWHFTYNAVRNGVTDASSLDGWADLNPGDVYLVVEDVYEL